MYKFLIAIVVSICMFQDQSTMSWNHDYRLDWSDFKGKPTPQHSAVAVTASGISFRYSTKMSKTQLIDYSFMVKADFYPEQSWYLKEHANTSILNHERLHFDITELYARKFRQRIKNTTFTRNINSEMEAIREAINAELETMQNTYDAETSHSQNEDKQKEWQAKITVQLNKLAYYSS